MNYRCLVILILASGVQIACQSAPSEKPPAVAATPAAPAAVAASPETVKRVLASKNLAGYTLVNKDGKELYCRAAQKTGSRVQRETICLTKEEIEELGDASRRQMNEMSRRATPPPSK